MIMIETLMISLLMKLKYILMHILLSVHLEDFEFLHLIFGLVYLLGLPQYPFRFATISAISVFLVWA